MYEEDERHDSVRKKNLSSVCVLFHRAFLSHLDILSPSCCLLNTNFCVTLAAVIANCTWLRDNLTCTTAFGYQFNNTVTDLVIISVPQASHNHSGTYACNVTGTVSSGFEPCEFLIMPGEQKSIFC